MNLLHPDLSALHPVDGGTLWQRVYSELRDFLMVGGVPPGEKVTLRQLTTAFGTSLMPVREAVQRLAAEGALEILPNRAIRVPVMTRARVNEIEAVDLRFGRRVFVRPAGDAATGRPRPTAPPRARP